MMGRQFKKYLTLSVFPLRASLTPQWETSRQVRTDLHSQEWVHSVVMAVPELEILQRDWARSSLMKTIFKVQDLVDK